MIAMSFWTRSSADAEKHARCDIIWREEKYRQLFGSHTAISYVERVLTYRQAALPLLSVIRLKIY